MKWLQTGFKPAIHSENSRLNWDRRKRASHAKRWRRVWTIFSGSSRLIIFTRCSSRNSATAKRLDEFCVDGKPNPSRAATATGPELLVHITAGNIPNPALTSIVFGLLARSAQFVKCASGASFFPRLFAHSIYDADPKLGACLEIAEWRGGNADLENVLFAEADCVTATGSDETLAAIRSRLPVKTRFLGYGHRVSFGFVAREVLSGPGCAARGDECRGGCGGVEPTRLSFAACDLCPIGRRSFAGKIRRIARGRIGAARTNRTAR